MSPNVLYLKKSFHSATFYVFLKKNFLRIIMATSFLSPPHLSMSLNIATSIASSKKRKKNYSLTLAIPGTRKVLVTI